MAAGPEACGRGVLWLVRHGQTDWNTQGRFQGQADPPLNAAGLAEAAQAGQQLAGAGLQALFSSDLRRALQTAEVIARLTGLQVQIEPRLREVCLGAWEGMLFKEIKLNYPAEVEARLRDPLGFRPPGGETLQEVAARAFQAADEIAARYAGRPVAIVSHGLTLAALITCAQGTGLARAFEFIPPNAAPQRVTWPPDGQGR